MNLSIPLKPFRTFGGAKVPHRKHTGSSPSEVIPTPEKVRIPMQMHIGAPCKPLVKVGEQVLVGQKIGDSDAFISAPIHATISGKVTAIEKLVMTDGKSVDAVVITSDGENAVSPEVQPPEIHSREDFVKAIRESGLVGLGGGGFPTHVKVNPPKPVDTLLINAAECEPYITADYRRMMECTKEIVSGMEVVLSLFPNAEGIFAVEDNKKDCVEKLKEAIAGKSRMSVKVLETKYPQGAERQLIYATTKRAIHAAMLPADAGCIVDNVETLIAINQAVRFGKPLMERVVTVSGDDIQNPGNFRVPIGMNHRELVDAAGGFITEPQKLISGGPMMGFAMVTLDAPVTKTSSSILAFQKDEAAEAKETACINCGRCVEVCPSRIIPSRLADLSERHNEEGFVKMNGLECVECGSCSFVCPAKRNLKQAIGSMRKIALANKRK